jgi:hypothetical protein
VFEARLRITKAMPRFSIRMINSTFVSTDEGEFSSLDSARLSAVTAATNIVSESIAEGELASAVEVQIFEDERLVSRQVVTLSVAEFTTGQ